MQIAHKQANEYIIQTKRASTQTNTQTNTSTNRQTREYKYTDGRITYICKHANTYTCKQTSKPVKEYMNK